MLKSFKRIGIVAAVAAGTMALVPAAEARDGYYRHGDDTAAIAVGAGIIGLAVGAAIASGDHGYYRGGYYYGPPRGYYYGPPRVYYRTYPRAYYYPAYPRGYYYDYPRGHYHGGWRGHGHGRGHGW